MNINGGRAGIELLQLKNAIIMLFTVTINLENALHNVCDLMKTCNQCQVLITRINTHILCAINILLYNKLYSWIRETY